MSGNPLLNDSINYRSDDQQAEVDDGNNDDDEI